MASFNFPFNIVKNTPAIAGQVQTNFNDLLTWIMANLIQRDGTVAMTGPLVLAPGEPASPDHAANKAYVDAIMPVGIIWEYAGTTLPTGWLWCDGVTYSNTSQPQLANAIGRTWTDAAVPAGSFQVPDKRKRVSVGADPTEAVAFGLGVKGGKRDSEIPVHSHTIPAHGHTAATNGGGTPDHLHGPPSVDDNVAGAHDHNMGHGREFYWHNDNAPLGINLRAPGDSFWVGVSPTVWNNNGGHEHNFSVGNTGAADRALTHDHPVTVVNAPAFATDNAGAGSTLTDKNLPPYIAVNYIIYAGT
jgi:microcystin-dependent protein